jgi:hypothetical protein
MDSQTAKGTFFGFSAQAVSINVWCLQDDVQAHEL